MDLEVTNSRNVALVLMGWKRCFCTSILAACQVAGRGFKKKKKATRVNINVKELHELSPCPFFVVLCFEQKCYPAFWRVTYLL